MREGERKKRKKEVRRKAGRNRPFATMGHVTYPPLDLILGTL